MGEQFLKKLENRFIARGDQSKKALEAPNLLRNKPEILAIDLNVIPSCEARVQLGDCLHVEWTSEGIRVVNGNVSIGTIEAAADIQNTIAERGVVGAIVHACSAFGGITIRIREEDDDDE